MSNVIPMQTRSEPLLSGSVTSTESAGTETGPSPSTPTPEYAFEGQVIKLNAKDYAQWRKVFSAIPDFDAELFALDCYYADEGITKWFVRASTAMKKRHQEWAAKNRVTSPVHGFEGWAEDKRRMMGAMLENSVRRPADVTRADIQKLVQGGYLSAPAAARQGVR